MLQRKQMRRLYFVVKELQDRTLDGIIQKLKNVAKSKKTTDILWYSLLYITEKHHKNK